MFFSFFLDVFLFFSANFLLISASRHKGIQRGVLPERSGGISSMPHTDVQKPIGLPALYADINRVLMPFFAAAAKCGLEVHVSVKPLSPHFRLLFQFPIILPLLLFSCFCRCFFFD